MKSVAVQAVANLMLAPILVVAAAVLVKGYADTGDGFAGGAIAAAALLLQYVAHGAAAVRGAYPVQHAQAVAVTGVLVALAVALQGPLRGEPLLTHAPPAGAEPVHAGTLELITAVAFEAGVFLLVLGTAVAVVDALAAALDSQEEES